MLWIEICAIYLIVSVMSRGAVLQNVHTLMTTILMTILDMKHISTYC